MSTQSQRFTPQPTAPVANTSADPRFQRLVGHLHALGPRPTAEFLIEIAAGDLGMRIPIRANLERYARLDVEMVKALGADRWPASLLREVEE